MASRGNWGSKAGFILAASGSAIGLGNLWRFPYSAGNNGGGIFVLIYLITIAAIALPVLLGELSLGRFTGKNPVGAYRAVNKGILWRLTGYLGVCSGFMILSFYAVVSGWTLGYFFKSISGEFTNLTAAKSTQINEAFNSSTLLQIILLSTFIILTAFIVSKGVSGGIEKFSKIMMPVLFVILMLLLLRSLTLEGASKGLSFYLNPDFSKITPKIVISAMGQAFFSISLGMGTMITYGSYLSKKDNLTSSAGWIAFFDTIIALLAGLIIFPAIFSQGMNPDQGSGTMFTVLPVLFSKMPGGAIFGSLFFALISIAALTSTVSVLEVPVAYLIDEKKWSRKRAAWIAGSVSLVFGVPAAIYPPFFKLWNFLWGDLALSIGALLLTIFVGYVWKTSNAIAAVKEKSSRFRGSLLWSISIKYLSPVLITVILLSNFL